VSEVILFNEETRRPEPAVPAAPPGRYPEGAETTVKPILKKSFDPNSALGAHIKSSKYWSISPGCDPHAKNQSSGKPRSAGDIRGCLDFEPKSVF